MRFRLLIEVSEIPKWAQETNGKYRITGTLYRVSDNLRSEVHVDNVSFNMFADGDMESVKESIRRWADSRAGEEAANYNPLGMNEDYDFDV